MWEFSQKTNRVGEEDPLFVGQNKAARGGIQCRKKFVLGHNIGARQQIQKRRFTGIRVANHSSNWPLTSFPTFALYRAGLTHSFQLALQSRDPFLHAAPVNF